MILFHKLPKKPQTENFFWTPVNFFIWLLKGYFLIKKAAATKSCLVYWTLVIRLNSYSFLFVENPTYPSLWINLEIWQRSDVHCLFILSLLASEMLHYLSSSLCQMFFLFNFFLCLSIAEYVSWHMKFDAKIYFLNDNYS